MGPTPLGQAGKRSVARDAERPRLVLDLAQRPRLAHAQDLGQTLQEIPRLRKGEVVSAPLSHAERHPRVGDRQVRQDLHHRPPLRPRALQEGATARGRCRTGDPPARSFPWGAGGGRDLGLGPALHGNLRGGALTRRGRHGKGGDAGDGREGLAPEPQRHYGLDVFDVADLARRVPQDGEFGVIRGHPRRRCRGSGCARCRHHPALLLRGRRRRPGRSRPVP